MFNIERMKEQHDRKSAFISKNKMIDIIYFWSLLTFLIAPWNNNFPLEIRYDRPCFYLLVHHIITLSHSAIFLIRGSLSPNLIYMVLSLFVASSGRFLRLNGTPRSRCRFLWYNWRWPSSILTYTECFWWRNDVGMCCI